MNANQPHFLQYATDPTPHLLTFIVVTAFLIGVSVYYYLSLKKLKPTELPKGFAFLIFLYVNWIKDTCYDILGKKYERFNVYFIYLFSILFVANMFSIAGLEPIGNSSIVPLSLSIFAFIITIGSGIKFRKWSYINEYVTWISYNSVRLIFIPDPLKIIGKFSPVISLAFRFWGNILASGVILGLLYYIFNESIFNHNGLNFLGAAVSGMLLFPFHFYFDLLDGVIQPLIFLMLTMSYWAIEADLSEQEKHGDNLANTKSQQLEATYSKVVLELLNVKTNNLSGLK